MTAASVARAHFSLRYPAALGELREQEEGTAPCGGYAARLGSNDTATTDFHVGGDAVLVTTGHPQNKWLYRITVPADNAEDNASNWTQVYPIVLQSGLNSYCQPAVTVPDAFLGRRAILSVVGKATDGLLYQVRTRPILLPPPKNYRRSMYNHTCPLVPFANQDICLLALPYLQCAAVTFVSGRGTPPSACTNSTGVDASFDSDSDLSALVGTNVSSNSSSTNSSGETPSETPGAAPMTYGSAQGLGSLLAVGMMVVLGAGLMV